MNRIAVIGCGNLGSAIAEGLLDAKFCDSSQLTLTKRKIQQIDSFSRRGVRVTDDNLSAVENSDVIILAVKPLQAAEVLQEIGAALTEEKLLISLVTGLHISEIECRLFNPAAVIRAMPNTAVAVGESMTCICVGKTNVNHIAYTMKLFQTLGKVVVVDEKLMDASTVLAACGTAFALRYIRACIQGGIEIGFDSRTAGVIAAQTVKGAAELLLRNGAHPEQEIDKVTTPKGCTIAGLNEMEHHGFSSSLIRGVCASFERIS